jgi:hypothetical protein
MYIIMEFSKKREGTSKNQGMGSGFPTELSSEPRWGLEESTCINHNCNEM